MTRLALTYLTCICIAIGALVVAIEAKGIQQHTYLLKPRDVSDTVEALGILRRFIPKGSKLEERCKKYAVTLSLLNRQGLDQFKLAEIGLSQPERVSLRYREIDIETLRQLYIDGINEFKDKHIDLSLLELKECLSNEFKSNNRQAKKLLNSPELKAILDQYNLVMSTPLTFLTEPTPDPLVLTKDMLVPSVKKTLLDLFNGDEDRLNSRLASNESTHQATSKDVAESLKVDASANSEIDSLKPEEELTEDEAKYISQVLNALHSLYNQLPTDLKLNDRCQAYGRVIKAEDPNEHLIADILSDHKVSESTPDEEAAYVPEKEVRDNFLFMLSSFGKQDIGQGTWIDMVDCISQWEEIDPDVESYMNSEEQVKIFEMLMEESERESAAKGESISEAHASVSA